MNKDIDASMKLTEDAVKAYGTQENSFKDKDTKSKQTQALVKTIIAGQEERLNWPRFLEVESAAIPKPGEKGNLTETDPVNQVKLWRGEGNAGLKAYEWFQERMRKGVPSNEAVADAMSKQPLALAMINVEAIYSRWVYSVPRFLEAVDNKVFDEFKDTIADNLKDEEKELDTAKNRYKPKAADGAAWVVEIRGYTDFKEGPTLVKQGAGPQPPEVRHLRQRRRQGRALYRRRAGPREGEGLARVRLSRVPGRSVANQDRPVLPRSTAPRRRQRQPYGRGWNDGRGRRAGNRRAGNQAGRSWRRGGRHQRRHNRR